MPLPLPASSRPARPPGWGRGLSASASSGKPRVQSAGHMYDVSMPPDDDDMVRTPRRRLRRGRQKAARSGTPREPCVGREVWAGANGGLTVGKSTAATITVTTVKTPATTIHLLDVLREVTYSAGEVTLEGEPGRVFR